MNEPGDPFVRSAVLQAMVQVMAADGVLSDEEIDVICSVYGRLSGQTLTPEAVRNEATHLGSGRQLADFAPRLSEVARREVLRAACWVAQADDDVVSSEHSELVSVATALGLSAHDVSANLN